MNLLTLIKKHLQNNTFSLVGIFLILIALPFTLWQLQTLTSFGAKGADFSLTPYPGLEWSIPKEYTVSLITNPQTPNESLFISKGMAVTTETNENISTGVYSFYDKLLKSKQFTQIKLTGQPGKDIRWVATYSYEGNMCQVQFYPTPYKEGMYTILLYFGNAAN